MAGINRAEHERLLSQSYRDGVNAGWNQAREQIGVEDGEAMARDPQVVRLLAMVSLLRELGVSADQAARTASLVLLGRQPGQLGDVL